MTWNIQNLKNGQHHKIAIFNGLILITLLSILKVSRLRISPILLPWWTYFIGTERKRRKLFSFPVKHSHSADDFIGISFSILQVEQPPSLCCSVLWLCLSPWAKWDVGIFCCMKKIKCTFYQFFLSWFLEYINNSPHILVFMFITCIHCLFKYAICIQTLS